MGLFGLTLFAQAPGDAAAAPAPPQQADKDKDKKPAPAKAAANKDEERQPELGVSVDSGRKSDALATWVTTENNPGRINDWVVKQSIEFGGRFSDYTGNTGTWDTFVNLGTGPRLSEYTLDMHSPKHTGLLFDDFLFSNFGYGGDPNNLSRVRAQKGKIYSFNAMFRRDQNIFDYDLLANPLNPSTSVPNVPILHSPHEFLLTRRMSDVNLTLFPVGKLRFRLGWSRVVNEGTSFSTDHQGTDTLIQQPTLNTTDNYSIGVSWRIVPRTSINYDQFFTFYKGDTTGFLAPASVMNTFGVPNFTLSNGVPVNLGLPFNSGANIPCAPPAILATGFASPTCNGFLSYTRDGRNRNTFPTEQFSFQSNYFRNADFSGRLNYSDAEASTPSTNELFNGQKSNRFRGLSLTGAALTKRISLAGDLATTIRLTDRLRLVDSFRYDTFRIPGLWNLTTNNVFAVNMLTNPNLFTPSTCPPPFTAATCPQHVSGSAADNIVDLRNDFLKQTRTSNTINLEYDFTKRITAHAGYRFERREITSRIADTVISTYFPGPTAALANRGACSPAAAHPLNPDGTCTAIANAADVGEDFVEINGHSALMGFSARPVDSFRLSADAEFFYGDNTFFRVTPRHSQDYRIRAQYRPESWMNLGAAVRILETRNTTADIGGLGHNRSYAFSGVFAPAESRWALDLSYDYNDIFSQSNICFTATTNLAPPGTITCGTPFLSGNSVYTDVSHFAAGSLILKPWKRVTAGVGYSVTSTSGNTTILNPIAPTGPLAFNYHLPTASLAVDITRSVAFKTGWNYYGYNEKSDPGPTLPRDFRGNVFTVGLRYSM
jgi:hypothetical protein